MLSLAATGPPAHGQAQPGVIARSAWPEARTVTVTGHGREIILILPPAWPRRLRVRQIRLGHGDSDDELRAAPSQARRFRRLADHGTLAAG